MRSPRSVQSAFSSRREQIAALEADLPGSAQARRQQPDDGERGHRFAAAGFADDADDLAVVDSERSVPHDMDRAFRGGRG